MLIFTLLLTAVAGTPQDQGTPPQPPSERVSLSPPGAEQRFQLQSTDSSGSGSSTSTGLGFHFRQAGHVGIGIGGGTWVSGLSAKFMLADQHALQLVVGYAGRPWGYWRDWSRPGFGAELDYLYHFPEFFQSEVVNLGWNIGVGGTVGIVPRSGIGIGVNGIVGFEILFQPVPMDLVIEYHPGIMILAGGQAGIYPALLDFSAHLRWWF